MAASQKWVAGAVEYLNAKLGPTLAIEVMTGLSNVPGANMSAKVTLQMLIAGLEKKR